MNADSLLQRSPEGKASPVYLSEILTLHPLFSAITQRFPRSVSFLFLNKCLVSQGALRGWG